MSATPPTLAQIGTVGDRIAPYVARTPTAMWRGPRLARRIGADTEVTCKLELLQRTGTFKARGAVANVLELTGEQLDRGLTTVSGGNHAIAVAYAAACRGAHAKVVMMATANPARIDAARRLGAEVLLADDPDTGFAMADAFVAEEGRSYIHGFDGVNVTCATAGLSLELLQDAPDLDAIVVPVGGGGLASGVAAGAKVRNPNIKVYGVQPRTAGAMIESLAAGKALSTDRFDTIADSLASPKVGPYSLSMVERFVDEMVEVDDEQMAAAIALLFDEMKLAVEPAAAASTAGLLGPLKDRLQGKRVGLIVCGSNIDPSTFGRHLARGMAALEAGVLG